MWRNGSKSCLLVAVVSLLGHEAHGRDDVEKGRWRFSGGISYLSTTDQIRSGAADILIGEGEENEFFIDTEDVRADINQAKANTIEETFRLDFAASYSFRPFFNDRFQATVELSASYFEGDVGPLEIAGIDRTRLSNTFPADGTWLPQPIEEDPRQRVRREARETEDGIIPDDLFVRDFSDLSVTTATVTQMPVLVSGKVHFRHKARLDPYLGAGIGYMFTSLEDSAALDEFNQFLGGRQGVVIFDRFGEQRITPEVFDDEGVPLFQEEITGPVGPVTVELEDGFAWQLVGGIDWYLSKNWSIYVEGEWLFTNADIEIRLDEAPSTDPVDIGYVDFIDPRFDRFLLVGEDVEDIRAESLLLGRTRDDIVIETGDINLEAFSVGIGVRYVF